MAVRKHVSEGVRECIIKLLQRGFSDRKVANLLAPEVTRNVVRCTRKKFNVTNSVKRKSGSGRKKSVTPRGERRLVNLIKHNRRTNLQNLTRLYNQGQQGRVSESTISRAVRRLGYNRRLRRKKIVIRVANRVKRVDWAKLRRNDTVDSMWRKVIFSDEMKVEIGLDRRVYVWRKSDEEWEPSCLDTAQTQRKLTVYCWGCITYNGIGTLTFSRTAFKSGDYIQLLEDNLYAVVAKEFPRGDYIFQQDNAPWHTSNETKSWLELNEIPVLDWPSQSPDLNIIENVWLIVKNHLRKREVVLNDQEALRQCITEAWEAITVEAIRRLYNSIPRRIQEVIRRFGYITKY